MRRLRSRNLLRFFLFRSKLLHTASRCPRGRWEQAKPSPPRLARHVIECTQFGAIIAALAMGIMPTISCR